MKSSAQFISGAFMVYTEMALQDMPIDLIIDIMRPAGWTEDEVIGQLKLVGGANIEEWPGYVTTVLAAWRVIEAEEGSTT